LRTPTPSKIAITGAPKIGANGARTVAIAAKLAASSIPGTTDNRTDRRFRVRNAKA
jgi:hypothetical protein